MERRTEFHKDVENLSYFPWSPVASFLKRFPEVVLLVMSRV